MITVTDIWKGYGKRQLIKGFYLKVKEGEMIAITGESGKGKTTLLNIMGLLDRVEAGTIHFNNVDITNYKAKQRERLYRESFGFLFQNYALIDQQTVSQNLDIPLFRTPRKQRDLLKREALDEVGLTNVLGDKVYELSGGEQQRVAIARLLLQKPKVLFADEPTGALDGKNRERVLQLLKKLNQTGCTVIIVTHDAEVEAVCGRIIKI
ncbi:MAG: ATP-binding cassette domain-containing protein [Brochothrix sp.]|uniref:ABC transporter ATP-binding protein n=1 Tax=Brochothrix sp. TaxID=1993875 RepID=UPI002580ABE4|nr:ATP-binding cassette domain-containing protein [Brochothrix sp.]MBR5526054.1 ATP-binding cassette domain-containing protein [Brochothrix sp.]